MKVSELWLREWVNPALTGEQLAAQLTMAGLEVDARNPVAGEFDHVIVAEVVETKPHPQADKLTLCEVNTGSGMLKVVCGAANVRANLKVALALPGAHLPGGLHIKETKLRGEISQGMLCSAAELKLEESSNGILELPEDAPPGIDVREYLSLHDHVLDIDLTPNRADCFSVIGIAREVAALTKLTLKPVSVKSVQPQTDAMVKIDLIAEHACPQYCGRVITGISAHAVTPVWMKERLRRSGIRPLHPVVDVTNFVMLELGQPMHAFDLQTLAGNIQVRFSEENEELELLNGQAVRLGKDVLVIADQEKPLAIAGIMGGEASSVQAETTHIFLESAFFNPTTIAGVARRYGLCTDSSQRFERGVDPSIQTLALERATELLQAIAGGEAGPISVCNKTEFLPQAVVIQFNPEKVERLSGVHVSQAEMETILQNLGMNVMCSEANWEIQVPAHRFDIRHEVDLVEEIIRLHGYENIIADPMISTVTAGEINPEEQFITQASVFFKSRGYFETISYSFVDPELQEAIYPQAHAMQLLNPISQELSQMRAGMWPGLLASMIYNAHRQQTSIRLFEAGVVFKVDEENLQEELCLAGLAAGEHGTQNWSEMSRKFDFYDVKGDLQALFAAFHIQDVRFVPAVHPALHPGQSAQIILNGKKAGWLGALHPRLLDALDLSSEVFAFELSAVPFLEKTDRRYKPISKYPQIKRDLSLLVSEEITAQQIEEIVRETVQPGWLKAFDVFDVYKGGSIPADKKSLAITLILQDDNRTLVDAEINAAIDAIITTLDQKFAITLRD
ncbi:phenylalanine--tRNA ligase subunit beta [Legionella sp. 27cVA30]|uniref:phenylalanine--tRNA ligase subunit beta n=1 Tax=Legionella sp. 27cVA30 TaxID=2905657 RepID=UPI00209EEDD0|nr:phenylalanine--tRNA ligase subunit beta [Legionella sp. 27cVA30]MCP0914564.1 phenylalanine--tRNA ligase subunit beta [Legionella sp. 27cVA30]